MTQADLRGFYHPLGLRMRPGIAKYLFYTTINLPAFMSGTASDSHEVDSSFVSADSGAAYEQHVEMAKAMAEACDVSQVEAIGLLLRSMIRKMKKFRKQRDAGQYDGPEGYISELSKDNIWGITVLSMMEGFDEKFKHVRKISSPNYVPR
jgi:hypothetical protein